MQSVMTEKSPRISCGAAKNLVRLGGVRRRGKRKRRKRKGAGRGGEGEEGAGR